MVANEPREAGARARRPRTNRSPGEQRSNRHRARARERAANRDPRRAELSRHFGLRGQHGTGRRSAEPARAVRRRSPGSGCASCVSSSVLDQFDPITEWVEHVASHHARRSHRSTLRVARTPRDELGQPTHRERRVGLAQPARRDPPTPTWIRTAPASNQAPPRVASTGGLRHLGQGPTRQRKNARAASADPAGIATCT